MLIENVFEWKKELQFNPSMVLQRLDLEDTNWAGAHLLKFAARVSQFNSWFKWEKG
jgi:hypothetical protein